MKKHFIVSGHRELLVSRNRTMNNIVSSEGAAKTTMCALLLGAVLNIGLDPLFIYILDMGVEGAAIATAISQMLKEEN
jgi:Na+-driven multidrug efflux pump